MAEPTVQVPVSLIERIDYDLGENAWHPEDCPGSHPAYCTCAVGQARRALRALLSQPTPTAEPDHDAWYSLDADDRPICASCGVSVTVDQQGYAQHSDPAPPSIADMVPGMTFVGMTRDTNYTSRWTRVADGLMSGMGIPHDIAEINPSTIRDVAPPTTQEER